MKYLILLKGSPAVGKSTWIANNSLQQYTISADEIRLLFQSPVTTVEGNQTISPVNDNKVWNLLYELVEERMMRGELIIVDATHSRAQAINKYQDMCKRQRYRCIVVDFSEEASLEEILERNRNRSPYKFVPENAIESIVERLKNDKTPSWVRCIKPNEFDAITNLKIDYTEDYDKIVFFGDIHSCHEPLESYFKENPFSERTKYIFVGDLFDRGIQAPEVFRLLDSIKDKQNVIMITGNHELHLLDYVYERKVKSSDAMDTIDALIKDGITKSSIKKFADRLAQFAYFEYHGKTYCVTHGGIPTYPSIFTPSIEYIRGVGKYEDSEVVDKSWCANTTEDHYSIHGHRNIYGVQPKNTERTFNLNGSPEYGEHIVVLEITKDSEKILTYSNTIFKEQAPSDRGGVAKLIKDSGITPSSLTVAELISHGGVNVKELGDDVFSLNFDRNVFHKKRWCDITVKARGLFIDKDSNIVARSYNKFFNINEMEETKPHSLQKSLVFPVYRYQKENGFLGILSVRAGEFFIASKSTNKGVFKEYFETLVKPHLTEDLKNFLVNKTMVFEVIDVHNDPHIIEYDWSHIVLLDVVDNEFDYNKLDYSDLVQVGLDFGMKTKLQDKIFNNFDELMADIEEVQSRDEMVADIEGYVYEDSTKYAFKVKAPYYNFWKKQRKYFEVFKKQGMNNSTKKMLHTANDFKVWNALIENGDIDFNLGVIEIRNTLGME